MATRLAGLVDLAKHLLNKGLDYDTKMIPAKACTYYDECINAANEAFAEMAGSPDVAVELQLRSYMDTATRRLQILNPALDAKGDPAARLLVESDMLEKHSDVRWTDIAGMTEAKLALTEMVLLPTFRRDIYSGLRAPPRGLLLFGPPGNGKTHIARAVAAEARATFFSVSASTIMTKFVGGSEKLVRALFLVAKERAPSIIFIDEIDSLLSARSSDEHEASRKVKTEFLVNMDGFASSKDDRVVVMAATNRPADIDEAARRRFPKRLYIRLPDKETRRQLLERIMTRAKSTVNHSLVPTDFEYLAAATDTYSSSDISNLCTEAAMYPLRDLGAKISTAKLSDISPVSANHFRAALKVVKPSVDLQQLAYFDDWNAKFGVA
jgi:SpoVK/Ycf46/Vps4 family AAA+-type ATPase